MVFRDASATIDGDDLFQPLFGVTTQQKRAILGAVFMLAPPRTRPRTVARAPTDRRGAVTHAALGQDRIRAVRLVADGWTADFHADSTPGFPQYPPHTAFSRESSAYRGTRGASHTPQSERISTISNTFFSAAGSRPRNPFSSIPRPHLRDGVEYGIPRLVHYYGPA